MRYELILLLYVVFVAACGGGSEPAPGLLRTYTTEQGVKVVVVQGEDPTTGDLVEIDRQISDTIEIAKAEGYVGWPSHGKHVIELISPSDKCETPGSFQLPAGQYDGDVICVAGQYEPTNNRIRTTLVAVRSQPIVRYESEHYGLRLLDRARYLDTLTHVPCPPKCHPILGEKVIDASPSPSVQ